jgi:H+-transporting ATPase
VLGIATVLGVCGVVSAFGLFFLGERVFHLDRAHIQTLMYLKLSVAGHLTIFLTRTRGPFWSIRPAKILWMAVLGTQTVATLIAVYGLFMTPLGWGWAMFVWGYAIAWALVNDRAKLVAYAIFDKHQANKSANETPPEAAPKDSAAPEVKAPTDSASPAKDPAASIEPKVRTATDSVKATTPVDMTPQIAERAYEIYEQRGHNKGQAGQDWAEAEHQIRKDQAGS